MRNASYVEVYPDENRQAIIDYIIQNKTIDPTADGNWRFAELPLNSNVIFETSKKAVDFIPEGSTIQFGEGSDGFGKYSLN